MRQRRWLGAALGALGAGVATVAVLGPLVLGVIEHGTSDTTLNQLLGMDAAGLLLVAPFSVAVGVLEWRRDPAAPVLALAPAAYAVYTFAQVVVGQEYLRLPGNIERFFPPAAGDLRPRRGHRHRRLDGDRRRSAAGASVALTVALSTCGGSCTATAG